MVRTLNTHCREPGFDPWLENEDSSRFKTIKRGTSLVAQTVKRLLQCGRPRFKPWVGKIPWRRKWQSTPVLLPGKSHGQRSLVGYSLRGLKESDTTEHNDDDDDIYLNK